MSSHGHLAAMSAVLRYRYCTSHATSNADFSLRKKLNSANLEICLTTARSVPSRPGV